MGNLKSSSKQKSTSQKDDKEEKKGKAPKSLPKELINLYNYKCEYSIDSNNGSITFYPTPPQECIASTKELKRMEVEKSSLLNHLLQHVDCTKIEAINKMNDSDNKENEDNEIIDEESRICSFISGAFSSWCNHYPFKFKPDHIWLLILQSIASHVDANTEKLRNKFVTFEGKKTLNVYVDEYNKGDPNNDWSRVIKQFADQIDKNTVSDTVSLLDNNFTSSSMTDKIAVKCTIMDICKGFFEYRAICMCGFPQITLEGNKNDWIKLREKAEKLLKTKCTKKFGIKWSKALLPLLDRFIDTFDGKIDCLFWNSMIKRGSQSIGSGGDTWSWYTGWINILFPFIQKGDGINEFCVPYSMDAGYVYQGLKFNEVYGGMWSDDETNEYGTGIDIDRYPPGVASAPVIWECNDGKTYNLKFVSGFIGYKQDKKTLEITPNVSWFIAEK